MRARSPSVWPLRYAIPFALFVVASGGCGGNSAPQVDPRPLNEAGIPDRAVWEAGPSDAPDATDGSEDADLLTDASAVDGTGGDAGPDVAGGNDAVSGSDQADAAPIPTTMTLDITQPTEGSIEVATRRFAPACTVIVTTDANRSDDVKQVDADLWSTGAASARISTTRLVQLNKTGGVVGAGTDAGTDAGTVPDPDAATGVAPSTTVYTFGDTPIDLSALTTGTYELRVVATTLAGVTAQVARTFRADAGPIIKVLSPTAEQAARGSIFVSVQVIDPFSTTAPTVSISVASLPVLPLTVTGNLYQATVAETIAMPPLSGTQLLDVAATNAAGVAARPVVVRFVFDDAGPTFANAKPATGTLIGGIVNIETDVTDPAGVDANTVIAVVAHGGTSLEVKLDKDPNDSKHYAHLFDTRRLSNSVLYPTISFRASDLPGNQANIGYTVAVDNTPPLADLDPPADLRIRRNVNGSWRCSWEFDPLGTDAVNDGDLVLQLFDIRARVEDEGNTPAAGGADVTPMAGLDPAHVELLVLDNTNRALVVDSDNDGLCDAVNPQLVPTTTPMSSQDALMINLASVPPTGAADFTADPNVPMGGFPDCGIGNDTLLPPLLCKTSSLTIAIPARQTLSPAIWAIPNVVPGTVQCVGNQFDSLGNNIKDGPACLAVRAIDRLGNTQVSRPLHVCIDHDGDGAECPFANVSSVQGGNPVVVTTAAPHGLTNGNRVLLGSVPILFDANGLWTITVINPSAFSLNLSNTPASWIPGGRYMRWTSTSDCTGRQTSINPVVVDDTTACRPWRRYARGEHLDAN